MVVTRGAEELIFSDSKTIYEQSSVETEAIDTLGLGAGDSFISMFLTHYYQLKDNAKSRERRSEIHGYSYSRG